MRPPRSYGHSGMCTVPGLKRFCRESYNEAGELYEILKQRGMDLVTITDHDSIDAAEELRSRADFFLSEEVTCTMPSGTEVHAGVYGIHERDHQELQRRRHDIESFLAYTRERCLFVAVNHIYSSLTGSRKNEDFEIFANWFPGIEAINGHMISRANRYAADFAVRHGKAVTGGSDCHTLHGAGRTFTEVPGAGSAAEFLEGLQRGRSTAHGDSGSYWKLTAAVCKIGAAFLKENRWARLAGPIIVLAPPIVLANYLREIAFAWYWGEKHRPTALDRSLFREAI